jgi:hypothetical protein
VRRNPSSDDLEKVRHTPVRTPARRRNVYILSSVDREVVLCATLVDFASGDGAHGDFVRDLVSDVVDRARRRCCYFGTGRLGVTPDERTEAAKACAAAAVHRHRVTLSPSSRSYLSLASWAPWHLLPSPRH